MVGRINKKYLIFISGWFDNAVINSSINKITDAEALFRFAANYKDGMQTIDHIIFVYF
jgi:hypothetical protein